MLIHRTNHTNASNFQSRLLLMGICLLGMVALVVPRSASTAIVNNNHLYQMSDTLNQKVLALARARKVSIKATDAPIFSDKLPIHLYAKSLDIYDQTRRLSSDKSLPDKELPNTVLRPTNVLELLSDVNMAMDGILRNEKLDPQSFERERPMGKNASEAFRDLWLLSYRLAALVPPPDVKDTLHQLDMIEQEVRLIAAKKQLASPVFELIPVTDKTSRDVMLVLYQDMHLLGRLQRELNTEAMIPGLLRSGKLGMTDIYDAARTILADLHRMKTSLSIDASADKPVTPSSASINALYSRAHLIHDLLLSLTGSSL